MFFLGSLFGLLLLALWIFCLADVLTTDEHTCRNLSKIAWLVLVLLLPPVGPIVWLVAGRPRFGVPSFGAAASNELLTAVDPRAGEEFLRRCRERAEEQRRKARGEI